MGKYKLFAQRIGLVGITNVLTNLSGLILLPILTKNLTIEEYGMWAQIGVTIGLVPAIVLLGLSYAMVRFLPGLDTKEEIKETFYTMFFIASFSSLMTSILIYGLAEPISVALFDNNVSIVRLLSVIVFFRCVKNVSIAYLRATQQIKKFSSIALSEKIILIALVSYFIYTGNAIYEAILSLLISSIIVCLILYYKVIVEIGFKIPHFNKVKEFLEFGIPTVPGNISSWIINSSDRYVIGLLLGTASVGYYSPGYVLGSTINMFVAPITFLLPSILSKHYDKNNMTEVQHILEYSFKYFLTIAIPATFGVSLLSKPLLTLLSTGEIATQSYQITAFVALSGLFFGVFEIISKILILEKKTKIIGTIWSIAAILNLGTNFIIIPYFGIIGAAMTTLGSFILGFILAFYYSFKSLRMNLNINFIIKSIIASILMSLVIITLGQNTLIEIAATVVCAAVTYFMLLFIFKGFNREELHFFKNIL